jgi:hypothetical protein
MKTKRVTKKVWGRIRASHSRTAADRIRSGGFDGLSRDSSSLSGDGGPGRLS